MVQVSAHRGGSEDAKPATYESYEHALTSGAEYAEFDIRKTRDDVLVVYHDARLRHTGQPIANLTYDELCGGLGYAVPRVAEVMEMLAGKLIGHLDLKETGYEAEVISLALNSFGVENFVATTLEDVSVRAIKKDFPDVRTALSLGRDLKEVPWPLWAGIRRSEIFPLARIRACGADWVAINYKLARFGVTGTCVRNGTGVMVWTVDSDELIDQFVADQRINVLITNRPRRAVERRAELTANSATKSAG